MARMLLCITQIDLSDAMKNYFSGENYKVDQETSGSRILELLQHTQYDIVILSLDLEDLNGITVVSKFRACGGSTPVLMLSPRDCSDERQSSLDAGADAYLAAPLQFPVLAAQLRALLRRPFFQRKKMIVRGNILIDTESGTVTRNDQPVRLHPMESKLLQFFLRNPNKVFDRKTILENVWQKRMACADDTVRTHIRTLRRKIDPAGCQSIVTTVRGFGYKVVC